jgi:sulfopropanediol 3-dehydrogenase
VHLRRLTNYGSLFLGANATVVYGDKGIGPNHVLPTGRAARYTGGLWVGKFLKTVTWQIVTDAGNARAAPTMAAIAEAENMKGHAFTARLRIAGHTGMDLREFVGLSCDNRAGAYPLFSLGIFPVLPKDQQR